MIEVQEVTIGSEEKEEVGRFQEEEEEEVGGRGERGEKEGSVPCERRDGNGFGCEVPEDGGNRASKVEDEEEDGDAEEEGLEECVCVWVKVEDGDEGTQFGGELAGQHEWWRVFMGEKDREQEVFWLREVKERLEECCLQAKGKVVKRRTKDKERAEKDGGEIVARKSSKRQRRRATRKRKANGKQEICEDEERKADEEEHAGGSDRVTRRNRRQERDRDEPEGSDRLEEKSNHEEEEEEEEGAGDSGEGVNWEEVRAKEKDGRERVEEGGPLREEEEEEEEGWSRELGALRECYPQDEECPLEDLDREEDDDEAFYQPR